MSLALGACGVDGSDPAGGDEDEGTAGATEAISASTFSLPWAVGGSFAVVQGEYGELPDGSHTGDHRLQQLVHSYDFALPSGTPVRASADGEVDFTVDITHPGDRCYDGIPASAQPGSAGWNECAGRNNLVTVRHADGTETLYAHLSRVDVRRGQRVHRGEQLGLSGTTGASYGPHLHFQRQGACYGANGGWCQSIPVGFDVVGHPHAGAFPVASATSNPRCWSGALDRFVTNACVQNPSTQRWNVCEQGRWRAVDGCPDGVPVYGFCQAPDGNWLPERSCRNFDGHYRQCTGGAWSATDEIAYSGTAWGGPIGQCSRLE